jgi:fatty acid desaturase
MSGMTEDKPRAIRRAASLIKILWTVSIITAATAAGAYFGWENHGLVGALALGFVGLVIGGFLSSPSALLQVLS